MSLIYDIVTAGNIAGYFDTKQLDVDESLGEKIFPARKQLGTKLTFIKGASGRPVVLKPAAFDTDVTIRERIGVEMKEGEMPFFKEAMVVKEADRQQLNMLADAGRPELIDAIIEGIFNDELTLLQGAKARLEQMRMQVLATGKIALEAEGKYVDLDYDVAADHKGSVKVAWTDAKATPLTDLEDFIDKATELGLAPEILIMNAKTFGQIRKATSTVKIIKPLAGDGAAVTRAELESYIKDNYGLTIVLKDGTFKNDKGEVVKYYPDGHITMAPNVNLGSTVFGTTPEESDLMTGNVPGAEVKVVETGIAVTTTKQTDPVNVRTKVSMIALPSFERLDECYMITTVPAI